jgi:hypothetical protein
MKIRQKKGGVKEQLYEASQEDENKKENQHRN